jgi:hypothetical protein
MLACTLGQNGARLAPIKGMPAIIQPMLGASVSTMHPTMTPMLDARHLMQSNHFRHLLVTKDDRLIGMVTDRDIRLNLPRRRQASGVNQPSADEADRGAGDDGVRDHRRARPGCG